MILPPLVFPGQIFYQIRPLRPRRTIKKRFAEMTLGHRDAVDRRR